MTKNATETDRDRAARIVALFSVLIHAWQSNEFAEAARARDELAALGVKVTIPSRRSRKGGANAQ